MPQMILGGGWEKISKWGKGGGKVEDSSREW